MRIAIIGFALLFALNVFADSAIGQTRAVVPKGVSTVNFKGIVYDKKKTLTLNLKAGQSVTLTVTSPAGKVLFDAYYYPSGEEFGTPLVSDTTEWTGKVPSATKVTIDLYTPDNSRSRYRFTVRIVK